MMEYVEVAAEDIQINDLIRVHPGKRLMGGVEEYDHWWLMTRWKQPVEKSVSDAVIGSTINSNGTILFKAEKSR